MTDLDNFLSMGLITRTPGLLIGSPGVGKSSGVINWAKQRGMKCWVVIASLREPTDFAGLPVVSDQTHKDADGREHPIVRFAPPNFAKEAAENGGVIFLDEITTAPPAVQAALLRAVLDLAFGDMQLPPDKVTIIAAANPPECSAGGQDLAPPLANRFRHRQFQLDPPSWVANFPTYWNNIPELGFGKDKFNHDEWTKARSLVAGFIRTRPTLLLNMPKEESQRGCAWPSPRTWDFASRQLAAVMSGGSNVVEALPYIADCVGTGAATEFVTWCREIDLPDPWDLLKNPDNFKMPERSDVAFAVMSSVVAAASSDLTVPMWKAAWKILAKAAENGGKDVAAVAAKTLAERQKPSLPPPVNEMKPFFSMLRSAGMMNGSK